MGERDDGADRQHAVDDGRVGSDEQPPPETVREIERERERRLDPANRPDNAVVDNTDTTLPTVERFAELSRADGDDGRAGTADPTEKFREDRPSDDEIKQIQEERERRTRPDNRPVNAEVDNTGDDKPDFARE